MRKLSLLALAMLIAGSAACTTTRAQTTIERPALEVPPPPPRVITPLPQPDPPMLEPVDDLPVGAKPSSPTRPNRTANNTAARDKEAGAKPGEKPADPPQTEQPPAVTPPPATPPSPVLRMPENIDPATAARQVRESIDRTRKVLNSTNYQQLTPARRNAYDQAKLFAQEAEEALREQNLVFAKAQADKAERLVKDLQAR